MKTPRKMSIYVLGVLIILPFLLVDGFFTTGMLPGAVCGFLQKFEKKVYDYFVRQRIQDDDSILKLQKSVTNGGFQVGSPQFIEDFDRITTQSGVSRDIVIVGIDEKTLTDLDQWPLKRNHYAKFLKRVVEEGKARGVSFDIVFSEHGDLLPIKKLQSLKTKLPTPLKTEVDNAIESIDYDQMLKDAVERYSRNFVGGYSLLVDDEALLKDYSQQYFLQNFRKYAVDDSNKLHGDIFNMIPNWKGGAFNFQSLRSKMDYRGFFTVPYDLDGVVREMELLAVYSVQLAQDYDVAMAEAKQLKLEPNFSRIVETEGRKLAVFPESRQLFGAYSLETINMASISGLRPPVLQDGFLVIEGDEFRVLKPKLESKLRNKLLDSAGGLEWLSDFQHFLVSEILGKLELKLDGKYADLPRLLVLNNLGEFKQIDGDYTGLAFHLSTVRKMQLEPLLYGLDKDKKEVLLNSRTEDPLYREAIETLHKDFSLRLKRIYIEGMKLKLRGILNPLYSFAKGAKERLITDIFDHAGLDDSFFSEFFQEQNLEQWTHRIKTEPDGKIRIQYRGMPYSYVRYSFSDVLNKDRLQGSLYSYPTPEISLRDAFEDKIVLLGPTAIGINDWRVTPVHRQMDGVELHANAIDCLKSSSQVLRSSSADLIEVILLLAGAFLVPFVLRRLNAALGALFAFAVICSYFVFCYSSFTDSHLYYQFVPFALLVASQYIFLGTYEYIQEEKERKKTRSAFQHYVNASVVNAVLEDPEMLKLGGQKREMTVLFSDVRSFTTISEKLDPVTLVALMNEYLEEMTDLVMKHDGTLDKFIGDAVMAFWGAPIAQNNHAELATITAIEMNKRLDVIRGDLLKKYDVDIRVGIGLNTGPMVVGNMGSATRFNYTIIGDAVNLGARLEGQTKNYGAELIVSQTTYDEIKSWGATRFLDLIAVKGKSEPVSIYECIGYAKEMDSARLKGLKEFEDAIQEYYLGRKFKEGIQVFEELKKHRGGKDVACDLYITRCKDFLDNPPDENWNGVFVATSK